MRYKNFQAPDSPEPDEGSEYANSKKILTQLVPEHFGMAKKTN